MSATPEADGRTRLAEMGEHMTALREEMRALTRELADQGATLPELQRLTQQPTETVLSWMGRGWK